MRKIRGSVLIAWIFCALVSVLSIYDLVVELGSLTAAVRPVMLALLILQRLQPMLFAIPAALIISHQPRNVIGWLLMAPVLVSISVVWVDRYLNSFQSPPLLSLPLFVLMLYSGGAWVWLIFPLLLIPLLFPTGRPPTRRWNWVVYLAIGMVAVFYLIASFSVIIQGEGYSLKLVNPVGFITQASWDLIMPIWSSLLVLITTSSLASIIVRYRKGSTVEREQIKWLLYASVIFGLGYIPGALLNTKPDFRFSDIGNLLFSISIVIIPAAITIAILRYKLFDIDVIIRLTLVYAVVTALLALIYVTGIIALQAGFRAITGQTSDVAVLVTTLAISSLFNPLRRRVQEVVDRRFYRQKYDAVQAVADFASAARGGADIDTLIAMLTDTVTRTLQPTQVNLFIRDTDKNDAEAGLQFP